MIPQSAHFLCLAAGLGARSTGDDWSTGLPPVVRHRASTPVPRWDAGVVETKHILKGWVVVLHGILMYIIIHFLDFLGELLIKFN